jgi:hypothetical protein
MSAPIKSQTEQQRPRQKYGRPTLVKRGKLASIAAVPATSGIATDTTSR